MSVEQVFNYLQIDSQVSTAGLLSEEQLSELSNEKFACVINLLPDIHDYAVQNEADILRQQGLEYCYIPVDFDAPTESDYQQFEQAMVRSKGKRTLVHCAANYRASAFYAVYAHRQRGWTVARSRELIGSVWSLSEFPQWQILIEQLLRSD